MQQMNQIQTSLNRNFILTARFFVIFYAVGIAGILLPQTFDLFLRLIPLALLLSSAALAVFHKNFSTRELILFSAIFSISFVIEAIGVKTAKIFGAYQYGTSLGIQIFETPLIIGLNWLLLVYLTAAIVEGRQWPAALKITTASFLMLLYDLVLEQVAPLLDMWYWQDDRVPLQNYVSWFFLAVFFHTLAYLLQVKIINKLAPVIFICQLLFLLSLLVPLNH